MKWLVYGTYVLQVVQSIIALDNGFQIFVTGFGDVQALDRVHLGWLSTPILTAICERLMLRAIDVDG